MYIVRLNYSSCYMYVRHLFDNGEYNLTDEKEEAYKFTSYEIAWLVVNAVIPGTIKGIEVEVEAC